MKTSKQPYNTMVGKSNAPKKCQQIEKCCKSSQSTITMFFFPWSFSGKKKHWCCRGFSKKTHKKDKYDALGVAGLTFIWPGTITHTVQGALRKSLVNTVLFMKFLIPTFINILTFTHFRPQNTNCCIMWRTTSPWLTKKRLDLIKLASVTPNPPINNHKASSNRHGTALRTTSLLRGFLELLKDLRVNKKGERRRKRDRVW